MLRDNKQDRLAIDSLATEVDLNRRVEARGPLTQKKKKQPMLTYIFISGAKFVLLQCFRFILKDNILRKNIWTFHWTAAINYILILRVICITVQCFARVHINTCILKHESVQDKMFFVFLII